MQCKDSITCPCTACFIVHCFIHGITQVLSIPAAGVAAAPPPARPQGGQVSLEGLPNGMKPGAGRYHLTLYCGRFIGLSAAQPGSDGFCGPYSGPQCASCAVYQDANGFPCKLGIGLKGSTNYYCGRFVGRDALPGSDGFCGPWNGPNCKRCHMYQMEQAAANDESAAAGGASAAADPVGDAGGSGAATDALVAQLVMGKITSVKALRKGRETAAKLLPAVLAGDEAAVAEALEGASAPFAPDDAGRGPLHLACQLGKAGVARLLLKAGCPLGEVSGQGLTPLHYASQEGYAELSFWLLKQGSQVDEVTRGGENTALTLAAAKGHAGAASAVRCTATHLHRAEKVSSVCYVLCTGLDASYYGTDSHVASFVYGQEPSVV